MVRVFWHLSPHFQDCATCDLRDAMQPILQNKLLVPLLFAMDRKYCKCCEIGVKFCSSCFGVDWWFFLHCNKL